MAIVSKAEAYSRGTDCLTSVVGVRAAWGILLCQKRQGVGGKRIAGVAQLSDRQEMLCLCCWKEVWLEAP